MTVMASVTSMPVQGTRIIQANSSFDQVLISDPVRRLFNQPNIVIHAIPRTDSPTAFRMVSSYPAENEMNGDPQLPDTPEIFSQIQNPPIEKGSNEEENLLPSKNNGKSEILLVPITRKRKECGHFEPCESLVCDVDVQQHVENEECTPLISIDIDEEEIDALATKHCDNKKCDALNIDHNRCRRVSILLNRCDKSEICDICKFKFRSRNARLNHKKCRRKSTYKHNVATATEVFKVRMRERELQILEAARIKKRIDYFDPVKGFKNTMDVLTNNDELIIIPKMPPKIPALTFPVNTNFNNKKYFNNMNTNNNSFNINNKLFKSGFKRVHTSDTDKELTPEMIKKIIKSCQKSINCSDKMKTSFRKIKLAEHFNGATVNVIEPARLSNQEHIHLTEPVLKKISQSVDIKHSQLKKPGLPLMNVDFNLLQEQKMSNIPPLQLMKNSLEHQVKEQQLQQQNMASKEFSTKDIKLDMLKKLNSKKTILTNQSYKVVPTVELKSEPSLSHQTQGIPNLCVVPDTSSKSQNLESMTQHSFEEKSSKMKIKAKLLSQNVLKLKEKFMKLNSELLNPDKNRPLQPVISNAKLNIKEVGVKFVKKQRKAYRKKMIKKGKYKCTVCHKKFSSMDYCKIHIAKHENKLNFFCRLCEKGFSDKYIMKKHIDTDHKDGEMRCEMCNCILPSLQELATHMKSSESKIKRPCIECSENFETCNSLDLHMRKEHGFLTCYFCQRQIAKLKIKKHLMLEHCVSQNRIENGLEKLTVPSSENDAVCEKDLSETIIKIEPPSKPEAPPKVAPKMEFKIDEIGCLAKGRSVRRRKSKEFFTCTVCERKFENEKQFQIHVANFPKKFTSCPNCDKKFHRKTEYTEHSKTCYQNSSLFEQQPLKKKKVTFLIEKTVFRNDNNTTLQNNEDLLISNNLTTSESNKTFEVQSKNSNADEISPSEDSARKNVESVKKAVDGGILKLNKSSKFETKTKLILHNESKIDEKRKEEIFKVNICDQLSSTKKKPVKIKNINETVTEKIKLDNDHSYLKKNIKTNINGFKPDSHDCLKVSKIAKEDKAPKIDEKLEKTDTEDSLSRQKKVMVKEQLKNQKVFDQSSVIANIFLEHNYQSINKIEN